jgi:hypothetical protein
MSKNPVILSIIHHRQNPLEPIVKVVFSHQPTTKQYTESLKAQRGVPVIWAQNLAMCL